MFRCFSLTFFLLFSPILPAATFSVNTVAQLETALATAENNGEDDTINITAGTYNLTNSLNYDFQSFNEKKAIALQGVGGKAVLDGNGLNSRVLFIRNSDADITIRNIIMTNGYAQEGDNGAGLFINISGGNLYLENCEISNSNAAAFYFTNSGGGAYITAGLNANINIRNCVIANNTAKGEGGGLYLNLINGTLTFVNNTVVDNLNKTSIVEKGGGIYLKLHFDSAIAHLYNNILWGNEFTSGNGDLYIEDAFADPTKAASVFMHNNNYNHLDWNLGDNLTLSDNISLAPLLSTDFHLDTNSPSVDTGTSAAPWLGTVDFEGDSRSLDGDCDSNSIPDIGADEYYLPATVSTTAIKNIMPTTAIVTGNVTDEGGHTVTERGVCWSTSENPDVDDICTHNGTGLGQFTASLSGLSANTQYFVRSYATTCEGTAYSTQQSFVPLNHLPFLILLLN